MGIKSVFTDLLATYGGTVVTLALGFFLHVFVGEELGLVVMGAAVGTLIDLNKGVRMVKPSDR